MEPGRRYVCVRCGGRIEPQAGEPAGELCEGCRLDTWIPAGYVIREGYHRPAGGGPLRAAYRPRTGRVVLDAATPPRAGDLAALIGRNALASAAAREASVGLEQDLSENV
jgi:hypothetical protein